MKLSVSELSVLARREGLPVAERRRLELGLSNSALERQLHQVGCAFDQQVVRFLKDDQLLGRAADEALAKLVGSGAAEDAACGARRRAWLGNGRFRGRVGVASCLWALGLGSAAAAGYFGHSLLVGSESKAVPESRAWVTERSPQPGLTADSAPERPPSAELPIGPADPARPGEPQAHGVLRAERSEPPAAPDRSANFRASAPRVTSAPSGSPGHAAADSAVENAATLFQRANAARRAGHTSTAIELYGSLRQRFAQAPQAVLACVSLGHLYLMQGAAELALEQFTDYLALASGGALAQEALRGKAVALGRLGRRAEEAAVWRELLAQFPHSVFRELAFERLESLP